MIAKVAPPPAMDQEVATAAEKDEDDEEEELDGGSLMPHDPPPPAAPADTAAPAAPPPPQQQPSPAPARVLGSFADELARANAAADREAAGGDSTSVVCFGEAGWRERYYEAKLAISRTDAAGMRRVCIEYVKGLCFVMRYYTQGCASWTWFYPYHYAPPASDLVAAPWDATSREHITSFELGEPFPPIEQLAAVLPPLSGHALPPPLAALSTASDSPLAHAFPRELSLDLNGASHTWKAVVRLPFVEAAELRAAFNSVRSALTVDEKARNRFGPTVSATRPLNASLRLARAAAGC